LDCHDVTQWVVVYLRRQRLICPLSWCSEFCSCGAMWLPSVYPCRDFIISLNSDDCRYGGSGATNGDVCASPIFHMRQPCSLVVIYHRRRVVLRPD